MSKSLIDTLNSIPKNVPQTSCKVCAILSSFTTEEIEAFNGYLRSGLITHAGLITALEQHGHSVSETTMKRHKRKCVGAVNESN